MKLRYKENIYYIANIKDTYTVYNILDNFVPYQKDLESLIDLKIPRFTCVFDGLTAIPINKIYNIGLNVSF